jgi:hypothetical protein
MLQNARTFFTNLFGNFVPRLRAVAYRLGPVRTSFGFDAVDAGPLSEGWRIQRDTPAYGPRRNAEERKRDLAAAKRYCET